MPIFADESSPEDGGTASDAEVDWEGACPKTVLVELARSLLVVPDAMVCAVLVRVDALRMLLGVVLTAPMVFAVLVGVETLRVPTAVPLTVSMRDALMVPLGVALFVEMSAASGL